MSKIHKPKWGQYLADTSIRIVDEICSDWKNQKSYRTFIGTAVILLREGTKESEVKQILQDLYESSLNEVEAKIIAKAPWRP